MSETCKYVRPDGTQCKQWYGIVDGYCHTHQPDEIAKMERESLQYQLSKKAQAESGLSAISREYLDKVEKLELIEQKIARFEDELKRIDPQSAMSLARVLLMSGGCSPDDTARASALVAFAKEARLAGLGGEKATEIGARRRENRL